MVLGTDIISFRDIGSIVLPNVIIIDCVISKVCIKQRESVRTKLKDSEIQHGNSEVTKIKREQ